MVRIENMKREDLYKIVKWNNNKSEVDLLKWAGPKYKFPLTLSQLELYFDDMVKSEKYNVFLFKIILEESNEVIGTIELREIENKDNQGWISGFLIGEEKYRNREFGKIVLQEVLEFAFKELNFEKVGLAVFDFNINAIKCYENIGFNKIKFRKNSRKYKDDYWSLYEMEILKEEWINK